MTTDTATPEDRLAVRELVERYALAVTTRDATMIADTFVEDGEWHVLPPFDLHCVGRAQIAQSIGRILAATEFLVQTTPSIVVKLAGNHGSAKTVVNEIARRADGSSGTFLLGLYEDEVVKWDGVWRFVRRTFRPLYFDDAAPGGKVFPQP